MPNFEQADRPLFDRIQERAYYLWEEEGRPLGRDDEHWAAAEEEIVRGMPSADPEPPHTITNAEPDDLRKTGAQTTY